VWDRHTGRPWHNAIVWQDTRTDAIAAALDADEPRAGDPRSAPGCRRPPTSPAANCSGCSSNVDGLRAAAERGDALFGTPDTWVIWNLTGGPHGGRHVTDVTNASRTMLMDLRTLDWDDELLGFFGGAPRDAAEILPSGDADRYGVTADVRRTTAWGGPIRIAATSAISRPPPSARSASPPARPRTLTAQAISCCSTRAPSRPLESRAADDGGLPVRRRARGIRAGRLHRRDRLGRAVAARPTRASSAAPPTSSASRPRCPTAAGCTSCRPSRGLFAPYWRSDARGAIVGLSRFNTNAHLARATLEAICYQTKDVADAMYADSGVRLDTLKVDGGVTANALCMQIQADILGVEVSKPVVAETTALGAAYAAGLAIGFWRTTDELRANWQEDRRWSPQWSDEQRTTGYAAWRKAVTRTLDWAPVSG
jgi:glycerol kinase